MTNLSQLLILNEWQGHCVEQTLFIIYNFVM
jgi:hypothetical protein